MTSQVLAAQSVAASGNTNATITLPSTGNVPVSCEVGVAVKYAAVAGTSGIQLSFQISSDGSTFTAAAETNMTVAPAAGALGFGSKIVRLNGPLTLNTKPIVAIKVTATNLDATNAASIAILSETSDLI